MSAPSFVSPCDCLERGFAIPRNFGQGAKGVVDTVRFVVQLNTDAEFRANIEAALAEIIDDPCVRQRIPQGEGPRLNIQHFGIY